MFINSVLNFKDIRLVDFEVIPHEAPFPVMSGDYRIDVTGRLGDVVLGKSQIYFTLKTMK